MFIYLVKRVLPFILTLIFGIGLGSIFGSIGTQRTEVAPRFTPTHSTYRGCSSRRRNYDHSSQTEQSRPTRNDPTLIAR